MEQEIKSRFTDTILQEAGRRYAVSPENIKLLDSFESVICEFERAGRHYILRLSHSRRRTPALIHGEVDWINYLAAGGAGVASAVLSAAGELVELIDDDQGGQFLATAFVRAPGGSMWRRGGWNDPLIENYGRLIGRIHALSKDYQPTNPAWQRPQWHEAANRVDHWLPASQVVVHQRFKAIHDYLLSLPQDRDSYGMIHQDAHTGNFFVDDDGCLTLFDFDDCVYGHFAYDLAMVLFYSIDFVSDEETAAFVPHFWQHFMHGYRQENQLDSTWLREIPHFLTLREIELYMIVHRDFPDVDHISLDNSNNEWLAGFMNGRRGRIEQGIPYLNANDYLGNS